MVYVTSNDQTILTIQIILMTLKIRVEEIRPTILSFKDQSRYYYTQKIVRSLEKILHIYTPLIVRFVRIVRFFGGLHP